MKYLQIDAEYIRSILDYDPETGIFTWKHRPDAKKFPQKLNGKPAGYVKQNGYLYIDINSKKYGANRLAWAYYYGSIGDFKIDHIDGNPLNNSISNLRVADKYQNMWNSKKPSHNTSGQKGVDFVKADGLWRARVRAHGKIAYSQCFSSFDQAVEAYKDAAERIHGEFSRFE